MKFISLLCMKASPSSEERSLSRSSRLVTNDDKFSRNLSSSKRREESTSSSSKSSRFSTSGRFTASGSFRVTKEELEAALRNLGPAPLTDEEVASVVAEVECDDEGCIILDSDSDGSTSAVEMSKGMINAEELREVFAVFDAEGDGKISAEDLLSVFVKLGDEECTVEGCRKMIQGVDSDGDGLVCFEDFARMMEGLG